MLEKYIFPFLKFRYTMSVIVFQLKNYYSKSPIKIIVGTFIISLGILLFLTTKYTFPAPATNEPTPPPSASPTPIPTPFHTYTPPTIKPQKVYEIALFGDSMTAALGPHGGPFTEYLNDNYIHSDILTDSYAEGSTNITSLRNRLIQETHFNEWIYKPIIQRPEIDLIIIESFAYNPLSHIQPLELALAEYDRHLSDFLIAITQNMPNTRIIFAATVAPNHQTFARKVSNLSPQDSQIQATERQAYLEHFISYAGEHGIPIINIYKNTLDDKKSGLAKYINPDDNIHPSFAGIELISRTMADFIYDQRTLPDSPTNE